MIGVLNPGYADVVNSYTQTRKSYADVVNSYIDTLEFYFIIDMCMNWNQNNVILRTVMCCEQRS